MITSIVFPARVVEFESKRFVCCCSLFFSGLCVVIVAVSIRGQLLTRQVRKMDHLHHKRRDELVRQWEAGDGAEDKMTLLKMARHERHPPCLLARIGKYFILGWEQCVCAY